MNIDHTLTGLSAVKSLAKLIPVVGEPLEAVVELLSLGCQAAQDVQTNKEESEALSSRAGLLVAVIVRELMKLDTETLKRRVGDVNELLLLSQNIRDSHLRRSQRGKLRRIMNKEKDKEEVKKLRLKLDQAIERFNVSASILNKDNFDAITSSLREIENKHHEDYARILAAQRAMNSTIISREEKDLIATLRPVHSARHDVEHAPTGCLENTRVDIIRQLQQWSLKDETSSIYWLSGLGGIGKTTIARTICDKFTELRVLGAAFFISRTSAERRNPQNVLRSIIHQLADSQPLLRAPICDVLHERPMIVEQSLSLQVEHLLLAPLRRVQDQLTRPVIIVIDAFDECEKGKDGRPGGQLLPLLLQTINRLSPFVKLLVTSRLDKPIQSMFTKVKPEELRLHRIEEAVVRADIQLYLEHSFRVIAEEDGTYSPTSWPSPEIIDDLAKRADKLFIFATTVINYIRHPRYTPASRLTSFLTRKPLGSERSPYDDLDTLYLQVLQSALGEDPRDYDEISQRLRGLLGVLVALRNPLPFFGLKDLLGIDEDTLRLDLEALSAVVLVPEKGSTEDVVLFHASFEDFITDPARCSDKRFLITSLTEFHSLIATRCCKLRANHHTHSVIQAGDSSDSRSVLLDYARRHSHNHAKWSSLHAIKEAVKIWRRTLRLCEPKHPEYQTYLRELSRTLTLQHHREGDLGVLQEIILLQRRMLELRPPDHPERGTSLSNLANSLSSQYNQVGGADILEEAISLDREALRLRPCGHPSRDWSLNDLADRLCLQYHRTGELNLLGEAVHLGREALELRPPGHPLRDWSLSNLSTSLLSQYNRTGELDLLEEATRIEREALELRPPGHPYRDWSLSSLASLLLSQYTRTGEMDPLDETVRLEREALQVRQPGHPYRDRSLSNLASSSLSQYNRTVEADPSLLEEAIRLEREALNLRSPSHPQHGWSLKNVANILLVKYKQLGEESLLEEAVGLHREALELCSPVHPQRAWYLSDIAISLTSQYEKTGEEHVLEEAICLDRKALDIHPSKHPKRYDPLYNLASNLHTHFEHSGQISLLEEAIRLSREALECQISHHPDRYGRLERLASILESSSQTVGNPVVLADARRLVQEVAALGDD